MGFNPGALILGGTLSGLGTVGGNITNAGTVHPGNSPGVLLAVEIDGTNSGSQYSQLNCSGSSVWLNGMTLAVTWGNGFVPSVGQSFIICTNGNYSGAFASLQGVHQAGVALVPRYGPSGVTLLSANEPTLSVRSCRERTSFSVFKPPPASQISSRTPPTSAHPTGRC